MNNRRTTYPVTERRFSMKLGELTFFFSSRSHCLKFKAAVPEGSFIQDMPVNRSLAIRFKLPRMCLVGLELVQAYRRIETAGFLIVHEEGGEATCPEQLIFTDRVLIEK